MKRTWVSRLAAVVRDIGRILAIVRLVIAATVLRFCEIPWWKCRSAVARERRYVGELISEVRALRERSARIAEHPYRDAMAEPARHPAGRGRNAASWAASHRQRRGGPRCVVTRTVLDEARDR